MGTKQVRGAFIAIVLLSVFVPFRSLTAEVYLTKDQALDLVLGADTEHQYDPKPIDAGLHKLLKEQSLGGEDSIKANFFIAKKDGQVSGYALIDEEIGKHLPITYIVGLSTEGKITRVEMMIFREVRGWEARERTFLQQFEGRRELSELKVGEGIRHVSGATLSSKAIAKGTARAVFLWEHFYHPVEPSAGKSVKGERVNQSEVSE